ncbi:plasmid pRiA4b ORF-3 family protein [Pseudomonas sp. ANT_J12]
MKWIDPAIWRRVAVSENITLGKLHAYADFSTVESASG